MLNTGGMRGRQKSLASKGSRLEEEELLLVFERDRALGRLCSLVFEYGTCVATISSPCSPPVPLSQA